MASLVTDSGRKTPARLAGSAILACQSDERLVELVREGHERAFDAIVDRYRRSLVRFSSRILPDSRTEDAVQQTFINAHAALLGSDDPVQLKPWLFAITRNVSLNMLRQNGWNYEQIPLDFDGVRRPDQVVEQRIELQKTVAAVNNLPDRQRDALVMREFEGRSYEEIALVLGTGDGAVRQLLNRARGTLRAVASAFIPPPVVTRAAASLPPSDGRRVAEVFGSLGAAGLAKAGATAIVAGSLVVGAVNAPLPLTSHHASKQKATVAGAKATKSLAAVPVADHPNATTHGAQTGASHSRGHQRGASHHGSSQSHHGSGHSRGGSDDGTQHRSGSDGSGGSGSREHRSGSDDSTRSGSGGSDDSTRSGSGSDDSTSGTSGTSGSDDVTTLSGTDGGSSGSGSGSDDGLSGSGTSGSGTSGSGDSGSSGSGTSGSGETTTTSSGTDGSGSGTSGSGTSDLTDSH